MEVQTTEQKTWTVLSLLNWSSNYFSEKGFESPRLNAELLLSHVLGYRRIELYTNFDKPLLTDELAQFKSLLKRRLAHEPLQYITGECEFREFRFAVDKRVLIPRPETEILVEEVMKLSDDNSSINRILDIGTGSGNIAVCLAKHFRNAEIDTLDVSKAAIEVAQGNVIQHQVEANVHLLQCDFLTQWSTLKNHVYDIIVSNPPYISREEFESLQPEVKDHEPLVATTDNADGLTFYRAIAEHGKKLLLKSGWIVVEMAYNQSNDVRRIFSETGFQNIDVIKDYSGIERVLKAQWIQ